MIDTIDRVWIAKGVYHDMYHWSCPRVCEEMRAFRKSKSKRGAVIRRGNLRNYGTRLHYYDVIRTLLLLLLLLRCARVRVISAYGHRSLLVKGIIMIPPRAIPTARTAGATAVI